MATKLVAHPFRALAQAVALSAGLTLCACATVGHVSQVTPVPAINNNDDVAVKGYDPVAYFTDSMPVLGNPSISTDYQGVVYRFASEQHKQAFLAMPASYVPQYGGFCAFAISRGQIADIDPAEWAVQDGHLYLNNNHVAQSVWNLDRPGNIVAGNANWPLVPKTPVGQSLPQTGH